MKKQLTFIALFFLFPYILLSNMPTENVGNNISNKTSFEEIGALSVTGVTLDSFQIIAQPSCGSSDGAITIFASGGTPPLVYQIQGGGQVYETSDGVFTGLPASTSYSLVVIDADGEFDFAGTSLDGFYIDNITTTSEDCGSANAEMTIFTKGGTPPIEYTVNGLTQIDNNTFEGLFAGTYPISTSDATGCVLTDNVTIAAAPDLIIDDIIVTTCGMWATVEVITSGGVYPLYFDMNGVTQGIGVFTFLSEGTYFVHVTDALGCTTTNSVTISNISSFEDIYFDCTQTEMTISPNNIPMDPSYTYEWTSSNGQIISGQNTPSVTVGSLGEYALTVYNSSGECIGSNFTNLIEFEEVITVDTTLTLNCDPQIPAKLVVSTNVFNLNLSYDWTTNDGSFIGPSNIKNPEIGSTGTYQLTYTDLDNGCSATAPLVVVDEAPLPNAVIDFNGSLEINCINTSVYLSGDNSTGIGSFNDRWNRNGSSFSFSTNITVTESGVYELILRSNVNNTCKDTAQVVVTTLIEEPTFTLPSSVILDCSNNFMEGIEPVLDNPSLNVSYQWTDAGGSIISTDSSYTFNNNTLGTFELEVLDNDNNCTSSSVVEVSIDGFNIDVATTQAGCDLEDGTAIASTILPNSLVEWSNGAQGDTVSNLAQGWYSVTVTDTDNNCNRHKNFFVDEDISCKVVIGGYVVLDPNNTCTYDANMIGVECVMVNLEPLGIFTMTDSTGYYEFIVDDGTYTVEYIGSATVDFQCPFSGTYNVTLNTNGTVSDENHFYVTYPPFNLCISKFSGNARPGLYQFNCLNVCNYGESGTDAVVTFTHDSLFAGQSPWPNIFPAYGNTIAPNYSYDSTNYTFTWNLNGMAPGECRKIMWWMTVPITASVGDTIHSAAFVGPIQGDSDTLNNSKEWDLLVTGSYDPNDKRNFVGETAWGGAISEDDKTMEYAIRFQNVGNDTAFTVVVRDTLDDVHLDVTTIRGFNSSHDMQVEFEDVNVLIFRFENINLVDSTTNEPESNGWVSFDIDLKPNLPFGTEITNQAAIYFDFNAPIITNELLNFIEPHYYQIDGLVKTEIGEGIKNVNILLSGDVSVSTLTDDFGNFSIEDLEEEGSFELNFEKNNNPWNGVTTQDIVAIRKHILGLENLDSPYKLLAADVNNSGGITSLDMVWIRSLILLNIMEFPENDSWKIIDGDFVFSNPTQPWNNSIPESFTIDNINTDRNYNMIGIKIGDVNNSAQPWNLLNAETRGKNGSIILSVDNQEVREGEEVVLSIGAKDFKEMVAFQFTLDFEEEKLNFGGFEKGVLGNMTAQNMGTRFLEKGKLTLAWSTFEGENINEDQPLFFLKFKAKQNGLLSEMLEINSSKTEAIAYDEEDNIFDIKLTFKGNTKASILQVFPNPTSENIFVKINLEKPTSIKLDIYNAFGQLEKTVLSNTSQPAGLFQQKINVKDFSSGIYFIKMKIGEKMMMRKFIVI